MTDMPSSWDELTSYPVDAEGGNGARIVASTQYTATGCPSTQLILDTHGGLGRFKCYERINDYCDGTAGESYGTNWAGWYRRECCVDDSHVAAEGGDQLSYEGDAGLNHGAWSGEGVGLRHALSRTTGRGCLFEGGRGALIRAYIRYNETREEYNEDWGDAVRSAERARMEDGGGRFADLSGCSVSTSAFDEAIGRWDGIVAANGRMQELTTEMFVAESRSRTVLSYIESNDIGSYKRGLGPLPFGRWAGQDQWSTFGDSGGHVIHTDSDYRRQHANRTATTECTARQDPYRTFTSNTDASKRPSSMGEGLGGNLASGGSDGEKSWAAADSNPYYWKNRYTALWSSDWSTSEISTEGNTRANEMKCASIFRDDGTQWEDVVWPSDIHEAFLADPGGPESNAPYFAVGALDWFNRTGSDATTDYHMKVVWKPGTDPGLGEEYLRADSNYKRSAWKDRIWLYVRAGQTYIKVLETFVSSSGASDPEKEKARNLSTSIQNYIDGLQDIEEIMMVLEERLCMEAGENLWLAEKAEAWGEIMDDYNLVAHRRENIDAAARRFRDTAATRGDMDIASLGTATVPPFFREQCFLLATIPYLTEWKKRVMEVNDKKNLPYLRDPGSETGASSSTNRNSNACLLFDGDPFGFMNRLTAYPEYANIMAAKTSDIANLQPLIRLFKIVTDDDGFMEQLEIPFDSHFTKKDLEIFRDPMSRGTGVGIKDFTFAYEGDNPFAVKKSISAKLTMHANNFTELLRTRYIKDSSNNVKEFKYVDLALKTGVSQSLSVGALDPNNRDVVEQNLDKLNFRLKVVVGWNYRDSWGEPTSAGYTLNAIQPAVRAALYDSYITLNLTPVIHEFDIDDQGRVKFIINYLAYVEDFFDTPAFNIFPNTRITNTEALPENPARTSMEFYTEGARVVRDMKQEVFALKCDSDGVSALKDELALEVEVFRVESLRSLMRDMIDYERVRYLNLTSNDVYEFRRSGPTWAGIEDALQGHNLALLGITSHGVQTWDDDSALTGVLSTEIMSQVEAMSLEEEDKQARLRALAATGADTQVQPVTFFYVSDLIDTIFHAQAEKYDPNLDRGLIKQLEALKTESGGEISWTARDYAEILDATIIRYRKMGEQLKNMRVLLGPMELVHQGNMVISTFPSIGDVPISVKYFVEWLSNKMSNRDEVYYSLPKFLNDMVNDLLRDILNDPRCFRNQAKQRMRLAQASVTSYKIDTADDPAEYAGAISHADINRGDKLDEITADILRRRNVDGHTSLGRMNTGTYSAGDDHYPLPVLEVSPNRGNPVSDEGVENEINWMIYYAGRTAPTERLQGIAADDAEVGIFHYTIGKDRGITKKIKLKKTDSNGLKELRFEQDGYDGLKQLREVFDVDIECYANVHAFPGQYIFVDPKGWAPNSVMDGSNFDLTQIGIGGYHMVVRSEHSFGAGYANSKIHAKWVASTHGYVTNGPPGNEDDPPASQPQFCFDTIERMEQRQEAANDAMMEELMEQQEADGVDIEDRNSLGWFNYVNPDAWSE